MSKITSVTTAVTLATSMAACAESTRSANPARYTTAPVRNNVSAQLDASPEMVWQLVSDHTALPSYSAGIAEVTVNNSAAEAANGVGCVRTCAFKDGTSLDERVVYWEPPHTLMTAAIEPNVFGLTNDLTVVTLRPDGNGGTIFTWAQHYDHPELDAMRGVFDEALVDLADRLVAKYGGERLP